MLKIDRETVDLDFLLTRMKAEKGTLEEICKEIAAVALDDGLTLSFTGIELLSQPHMDYPGYRITLNSLFAKMKDKQMNHKDQEYFPTRCDLLVLRLL